MTSRLFRFLVVLLAAAFVTGRASAQVIPTETIDSIDAKVLNAKTILIGTPSAVPDPNDSSEWRRGVTFKVVSTLKGTTSDSVRMFPYGASFNSEKWRAKAPQILVFVPMRPEDAWWMGMVDLNDPKLLVPKADFGFLRSRDATLRYVRELIRKKPGVDRIDTTVVSPKDKKGAVWRAELTVSSRYSHHLLGGLRVPVDETFERRAQAALRSKVFARRQEGLGLIRPFRSPGNAALLRILLKDPEYVVIRTGTDNRGVETRRYLLRSEAYALLRAWGEPVDPPLVETSASGLDTLEWLRITQPEDLLLVRQTKRLKNLELYNARSLTDSQYASVLTAKGLTSLSLTGGAIDDARLRQLVQLRHLRALNLDGNPITDKGLREFAHLPSLEEVSLNRTEITDEGLAVLRFVHPTILVHLDRSTLSFKNLKPIPETDVVCERAAYALLPGDLTDWSTEAAGRLTGPLEWSLTPSGRNVLGPLGQQAVRLKLSDLPKHQNVTVDIELFVIGSWDGDGRLGAGPDLLDVTISGVGTMLHSTFFNNDEGDAAELELQSFPVFYPAGRHKAYSGAAESRTLGFTETWNGDALRRDAVYRIRATFAHVGAKLEIVLTGLTVPQGDARTLLEDERWGIGNLVVRTD